jgi:hypothetical protein
VVEGRGGDVAGDTGAVFADVVEEKHRRRHR